MRRTLAPGAQRHRGLDTPPLEETWDPRRIRSRGRRNRRRHQRHAGEVLHEPARDLNVLLRNTPSSHASPEHSDTSCAPSARSWCGLPRHRLHSIRSCVTWHPRRPPPPSEGCKNTMVRVPTWTHFGKRPRTTWTSPASPFRVNAEARAASKIEGQMWRGASISQVACPISSRTYRCSDMPVASRASSQLYKTRHQTHFPWRHRQASQILSSRGTSLPAPCATARIAAMVTSPRS
jgi:hypothetical protein